MKSPEKLSHLGTISFILAILVVVVWCIYFIIFAATTEGGLNFGTYAETAGYAIVLGGGIIMMVITILLALSEIITVALLCVTKTPSVDSPLPGSCLIFYVLPHTVFC